MKAIDLKTGDTFRVKGMKKAKVAGTIIREKDVDISEATAKACKDAMLVVLDGSHKIIIPNKEVLLFHASAEVEVDD